MFDVFIMDMGGHDENVSHISSKLPHAHTMRYMVSHLEMVKRASTKSTTEFFWLISSCCNYTDFNFDYIPFPWEEKQIHCWASGNQKFGDTFLINKAAWQEQTHVEKLEWYNTVNYHPNGVNRLPWPSTISTNNLAESIIQHKFISLYTTFYTVGSSGVPSYNMNLWENREIIAFNRTGHVSICPRDTKQAIKTQIYDWPYIKYHKDTNIKQTPQDIVFISYDEKNANENWDKLYNLHPRAKRMHGVKGLVPAIKAAASESKTNWFYAVFGKTEIVDTFDFNYQPDYLRHPANYVFHAYNPILDHSYGHDGVVMYDKNWVLNINEWDLDLTMSHHVVTIPTISCINRLDITAWSAWRTAFREAYKLSYYLDKQYRIDDQYHLHLWLTRENTSAGKYSKLGANQGYQYYLDNRQRDYKINDWDWLKELFNQTMKEHQLDGRV
jgi:hypothetical protein